MNYCGFGTLSDPEWGGILSRDALECERGDLLLKTKLVETSPDSHKARARFSYNIWQFPMYLKPIEKHSFY